MHEHDLPDPPGAAAPQFSPAQPPPAPPLVAGSLAELLGALGRSPGEGEEGEPHLDGLAHGLQCAAVLRALRPGDLELQLAGLVHDVGHAVLPGEPALHGKVGADFVRPLLGERVAELVRLHVEAKRYLVAIEPGYRAGLSAESATTLRVQGEAMDAGEVAAFEQHPCAADALALRRADEDAKEPGREVPGLEAWIPRISQLAT